MLMGVLLPFDLVVHHSSKWNKKNLAASGNLFNVSVKVAFIFESIDATIVPIFGSRVLVGSDK